VVLWSTLGRSILPALRTRIRKKVNLQTQTLKIITKHSKSSTTHLPLSSIGTPVIHSSARFSVGSPTISCAQLELIPVYLDAFKIQSHLMFFDTGLNSATTMLRNIQRAFTETATKMWAYARCLPVLKQPPAKLIISTSTTSLILRISGHKFTYWLWNKGTIQRLVDTAYLLLISKSRKLRYPSYVCDIKKCEVSWWVVSPPSHFSDTTCHG
jgi:hypothetical protein